MNNRDIYSYISRHRTRRERWEAYDKKFGEGESTKVFLVMGGILLVAFILFACTA